jgi:hypothetical protein
MCFSIYWALFDSMFAYLPFFSITFISFTYSFAAFGAEIDPTPVRKFCLFAFFFIFP